MSIKNRKVKATRIREVVEKLVADLERLRDNKVGIIRTEWNKIDDPSRDYAEPLMLCNGVLWIKVESPAVAHHIMFHKKAIMDKLNKNLKEIDICEIRCKVGSGAKKR